MTSYLSEAEIDLVNSSDLSRGTPFLIRNVMMTQLSVSRHYGGCKFNGSSYSYVSEFDELVRDDVVKFVAKLRKPKRKKA